MKRIELKYIDRINEATSLSPDRNQQTLVRGMASTKSMRTFGFTKQDSLQSQQPGSVLDETARRRIFNQSMSPDAQDKIIIFSNEEDAVISKPHAGSGLAHYASQTMTVKDQVTRARLGATAATIKAA